MKRDPAREAQENSRWMRQALERYERPLTMYAARLCGDLDRARDIVQDTFMRLWTAGRAAVDGHLGQWLYRVCRNRALDVCRKEQRMTAMQNEHLDLRPSAAPRVQAADDADGRTHAALALLEQLSPRHQEVLRLKFQGGLSYQEIATVMDLTANHVGVLIHHALKSLREKLITTSSQEVKSQVRSVS